MVPPRTHAPREDSDSDSSEEETLQAIAPGDVTVAIFCALVEESTTVRYTLDEEFTCQATGKQSYVYTVGRVGPHNVVIAEPADMGTVNAAHCAAHVSQQFPNVRFALMVGIGAGIPGDQLDIRLGDVVISAPRDDHPGVIQYDLGKYEDGAFTRKGALNKPPRILSSAIRALEGDEFRDKFPIRKILRRIIKQKDVFRRPDSEDILFDDAFPHVQKGADCSACRASDDKKVVSRPPRPSPDQPVTHRGLILSGGGVIKNPADRDRLRRGYESAICFEMEAAGIVDELPCLVIRGISDYADTHKHDGWRCYAAAVAAAYCKAVLLKVQGEEVKATPPMRELMDKVNEIHLTVQDTRVAVRDMHATTRLLHADGHLDRIRRWLSPPDPSTNFNKAREQHHKGTGQWLLDSDRYAKWKTERNSFLWLNGIPGCGKTILSSSVVADLQNSAASPNLVYFYFDFNDIAKQSLESAVRSLVTQLYQNRTDLQRETDALYSSCNDGNRQPDSASLFKLFQSMAQKAGETWLVLDALDECRERNDGPGGGLLPWIRGLRDTGLDVHLLMTSRPEQDIQTAIESRSSTEEIIPLQSGLVSGDINTYIKAQTKAMSRWQSRPDIEETIESTLTQKADGMFRWVACQIDVLKECLDPESLLNELANLPRTLDATYARILQNIRPEHIDRAKRLLQFLTYSDRPLRVEEAVDAVTVNPSKQPRFDPVNRMPVPKEVLRYCSSLVVLVRREDKEGGTASTEIQLAHFSVQEYFLSDRLDPTIAADFETVTARAAIVKVCLFYLLDLDFSDDLQEVRQRYPLAQYSAQYWSTHAAAVGKSWNMVSQVVQEHISQVVQEYISCQEAFRFGNRLYRPDQPWKGFNEPGEPVPALYYVSFTGLLYSVQLLLDKGADVNAQGGIDGNALQAASYKGHETIVQLLLDKGADVNAQDNDGHSALYGASVRGHETIVQLLLDKGADADAPNSNGFSALATASYNGHQTVARLLLDNGAEVDFSDHHQTTPLFWASSQGRLQVVRLLIQYNATVDSLTDDGRTALVSASQKGHVEVVQLLLDEGSDLHAADSAGHDALWHAMFAEHPAVEDLLLTAGAVAPEDFYGLRALFSI